MPKVFEVVKHTVEEALKLCHICHKREAICLPTGAVNKICVECLFECNPDDNPINMNEEKED